MIKFGGLAEWSIAAVLKTVGRDERPVGSNPTASAREVLLLLDFRPQRKVDWRLRISNFLDLWQIWYMRWTENPVNVVRVHEDPQF